MISDITSISGGQRPLDVTAEMADKIKELIYGYSDKNLPLAAVIGVLEIVKSEILDEALISEQGT